MGSAFPPLPIPVPDRAALWGSAVGTLATIERCYSKTVSISSEIDSGLPFRGLPLGCVHEVRSAGLAGGVAFASLLTARISAAGQAVFVAQDRSLYPLGLLPYGVSAERWIHVSARDARMRRCLILRLRPPHFRLTGSGLFERQQISRSKT